jgi:hypothetical protein
MTGGSTTSLDGFDEERFSVVLGSQNNSQHIIGSRYLLQHDDNDTSLPQPLRTGSSFQKDSRAWPICFYGEVLSNVKS